MASLQELGSAHPLVIQLNRLHDKLTEKDRELGDAHGKLKALKLTEVLKNKAVEELSKELRKLDEKLRIKEDILERKNIEIKKLKNEKKEALVAQYAAEATLRRVHAIDKDEDLVPLEAVVAPLEADIKMYKNEIAVMHEDKKALERITKSKELALVEAESILKSALERAVIVEEVQNHNMELKRQMEICQEENRILNRTNRQKVSEVQKLSESIQELEESILAGGAAANAIRDYQRQISVLNEEKKVLGRELARSKVSANRIGVMISNEWKDDDDKVMPVKQWLEERRFLQAEVQRLKDKLAASERTAKSARQIKEKFKLRLKTLEEGLKHVSSITCTTRNASHDSEQIEKPSPFVNFQNNGLRKGSTSQPRSSVRMRKDSPLRQPSMVTESVSSTGQVERVDSLKPKYVGGRTMVQKNLWACRSKVLDSAGKENTQMKENSNLAISNNNDCGNTEARPRDADVAISESTVDTIAQNKGPTDFSTEDVVSGYLYDRLQREVINCKRHCEEKDERLKAKNEEIKMLTWKVDTLKKAMEVEARKLKRATRK